MNSKANYIFSFMLGAAVGAAITARYLTKKYEDTFYFEDDEQEDSIENDRTEAPVEFIQAVQAKANEARTKRDITEYASKIKQEKYDTEEATDVENYETVEAPYVITPDEFGEYGYETISLTYYADDVLTDDGDDIIDDPAEIVGRDFSSHFGEYEDDSVFIRNDTKRCDYEILKDYRKYSELDIR